MSKPWTCRLGWHKWTKHFTEDGQPFLQCARCDKENSHDHIATPPGM